MRSTTLDTIKAVLNGDDTLTPADRKRAIQRLTQPEEQPVIQPTVNPMQQSPDRVLTFQQAAVMLGRKSKKTAMNLADQGLLKRVTIPNRNRAAGVTESSVLALVKGGVA